MNARRKENIQLAIDDWREARLEHNRLEQENCQDPIVFVAAIQGCICALDQLRSRIVEALDDSQQARATEQMADTMLLSHVRTWEDCQRVIRGLEVMH